MNLGIIVDEPVYSCTIHESKRDIAETLIRSYLGPTCEIDARIGAPYGITHETPMFLHVYKRDIDVSDASLCELNNNLSMCLFTRH